MFRRCSVYYVADFTCFTFVMLRVGTIHKIQWAIMTNVLITLFSLGEGILWAGRGGRGGSLHVAPARQEGPGP